MSVKIVIWDLDETFWHGTLSEGDVYPIEENISIVKELTDRGIMNSIVSKNDIGAVMNILDEWKLKDYFIFPSITWEPKGIRVKKLLDDIGLRARDALFVDDNQSNLAEVKYYNDGIRCVTPDYFKGKSVLDSADFAGKDDRMHSRLKQYHELEKRIEKKRGFASNDDFLRASNIRISLKTDCIKELDRIEEMVQRTNQLNYTKNRMDKEELKSLLSSGHSKAAYILAMDDFCDYGIVGFYLIENSDLIHYLFSCRILGLGIENYIYQKLGCPEITVVGEVAVQLESEPKIDHITEIENLNDWNADISKDKDRLLMIGGCDLDSASKYLKGDFDIDKEFNTVVDGHEIRTSDTLQLVYAKELDGFLQEELCEKLPFMDASITYATDLYSGKHKIIVISLVDDFIRGMYRRNGGDYYVTYGSYWSPEQDLTQAFSPKELKWMKENFTFVGKESADLFKANLEKMISSVKSNVKILFINGIDLDVSDWIGEERVRRNIEMNAVIDEVVSKHSNVGLIDMRGIVRSRNQLIKKDNRHYDRHTYYRIAQEIIRQSNGLIDADIGLNSIGFVKAREIAGKVVRKLKKMGGYFNV